MVSQFFLKEDGRPMPEVWPPGSHHAPGRCAATRTGHCGSSRAAGGVVACGMGRGRTKNVVTLPPPMGEVRGEDTAVESHLRLGDEPRPVCPPGAMASPAESIISFKF